MGDFSWKWVGRISALMGIPAGLIAILAIAYQPDTEECDRLTPQIPQAKSELDRAEGQMSDAESKVSKQEDLVEYLTSYLDRVSISGQALTDRRNEIDRELRQLSVLRARVDTASDRVSDKQSDLNRLEVEYRSLDC